MSYTIKHRVNEKKQFIDGFATVEQAKEYAKKNNLVKRFQRIYKTKTFERRQNEALFSFASKFGSTFSNE